MALAIIFGIILGALTVVFALQNFVEVTVTFFSWHFTSSLALVLLATLAAGIVISLLLVLPESIKNTFRYRRLAKANEALAEDLRRQKELTELAKRTPPTLESLSRKEANLDAAEAAEI
jgi:uncharacterized integral membrane protein